MHALAQGSVALGPMHTYIHIRQITRACVTTINYHKILFYANTCIMKILDINIIATMMMNCLISKVYFVCIQMGNASYSLGTCTSLL